MTLDDFEQEVKAVQTHIGPLLDDAGGRALENLVRNVSAQAEKERLESSLKKKKQKQGKRSEGDDKGLHWQFQVSPGLPLSFATTSIGDEVKHRLSVDLFFDITEPVDGLPSGVHNVAIRIWSEDASVVFREDMDAKRLREELERLKKRVMMKFHFDYANKGQPGPKFHLQIGGKQHSGEYFWLPDNWKLPRFSHHPMSLILACEFIAKTFFPKHHAKIAQEISWRSALRRSQEEYLGNYFAHLPFLSVAHDGDSFKESCLMLLWNS